MTAGVVIGGAGYEGVRHAPWHAQTRAAAAPIFQSVAPDANVPAPREHIPVVAGGGSTAAGSHGPVAKGQHQRGAQAGKANGRSRGQARGHHKHYLGDASVAARHVHLSRPVHPTHPVTPPGTHRRGTKPKHKQLPGPYDHGPPVGKKP